MRDGVHLATDVYLPDGPGPFPTLVTRMRGGRSSAFIVGVLLVNPLDAVERGYAVVVQEVRGRVGQRGRVAPVRARGSRTARTASTGCSPSRGATGGSASYGTAYSASTALYLAGARPATR